MRAIDGSTRPMTGRLFLSMLLIAGCGGAPRQAAPMSDPLERVAWIAGTWEGTGPDGAPAREAWQPVVEGAMRGEGNGETLRIESRGVELWYVAHPDGAAAETQF